MQITREVAAVTVEESDQCTVTLTVGTAQIDLTPEEAWNLSGELWNLGRDAFNHDQEDIAAQIARVEGQPVYDFDVDQEDA